MTSPCVMAAMIRSAPCWQNGQRAMSRANTRLSSRAQLQRGDPVSVASSSYPLLAWRGDDRPPQVAVGRQTAAIAHQVHARQGHERGQLLEEFHWREANARGAVRPRVGEGIDEIAVGVLRQALQRHRAAGGIADQALQLVAPMGGDLGVGMQGKALHARTAGTRECGLLALIAKARANASHVLSSPLAKGDALLHRGRHGAGELGSVIDQRIIAGSHRRVEARLQVSQPPQYTDDPRLIFWTTAVISASVGGSALTKRGRSPWAVRST